MSIFFITGTSGSGKSTLIQYLKAKLPNAGFDIHDFDEDGVPTNADKTWRQERTGYWLRKAEENDKQKKSTIICGVSVPSEILECPKKPSLSIYFGFIKVHDEIIAARLKARGWDEQLIQDNINWAHYLEEEVRRQKDHIIVDSNQQLTPEQIADKFIQWIFTFNE